MSLSDAHYFEEMGVKKYEEIHALLDSREKKDKLEQLLEQQKQSGFSLRFCGIIESHRLCEDLWIAASPWHENVPFFLLFFSHFSKKFGSNRYKSFQFLLWEVSDMCGQASGLCPWYIQL